MDEKDTPEAACKSLPGFIDSRVTQFYDPNQRSGRVISDRLPLNAKIAWDIYMFFNKGVWWKNHFPEPCQWVHQLSDTDDDSEYLCTGDELIKSLYDVMEKADF